MTCAEEAKSLLPVFEVRPRTKTQSRFVRHSSAKILAREDLARKCYSRWCINLKQEGFGGAWQIRVGRIILSTFIPTPDFSSSSSSSRLLEFSSKSLRETGNRKNSFVDPVYPYRGFQAIVQIPARPSIKFHPPSSSLLPFLSLSLSLSGNALRDWGR